jgi:uncharacterized membrane protein
MRDIMLIVHLISVAAFIGAAISGLVMFRVSKKQNREIFLKINTSLLSLNYIGKAGLTLLIISGGYLMTPYWAVLGAMPLLLSKLSLVMLLLILLITTSIWAKKAKKIQTTEAFNKLNLIQNFNLLISIAVIILAVLVFH